LIKGRKVITLCGSRDFGPLFLQINEKLTLEGNVVFSLGVWSRETNDTQKKLLDEIHLRKIDLSDEIYVINKGGKIGPSTRKEIEYARANRKSENYLEPDKPLSRQGTKDNTSSQGETS
jgi:hypothetical protein